MKKIRIFISSVQKEFSSERLRLYNYIISDYLLGQFFEPFLFEKLPASNHSAKTAYLSEVVRCDIYLGLFGKEYGYENDEGVSPTEREYDAALKHRKFKLIFLSKHKDEQRNPKELALITKAETSVVRKSFSSEVELIAGVYASLVNYLIEKEHIRTGPFDAAHHNKASLIDLDIDKIKRFVGLAIRTRNFPLSQKAPVEEILTHLNLMANKRLTNASLLLFSIKPQRFFITSEVRCAHFHGLEVTKPIPSYQVYKGDVFQLVDQAVDFVL